MKPVSLNDPVLRGHAKMGRAKLNPFSASLLAIHVVSVYVIRPQISAKLSIFQQGYPVKMVTSVLDRLDVSHRSMTQARQSASVYLRSSQRRTCVKYVQTKMKETHATMVTRVRSVRRANFEVSLWSASAHPSPVNPMIKVSVALPSVILRQEPASQ